MSLHLEISFSPPSITPKSSRKPEQLKQMVLAEFQCNELYVTDILPVVAVHNGEGLIGPGYYVSDQIAASPDPSQGTKHMLPEGVIRG